MPSSEAIVLDANIGVWSVVRGPVLTPEAIQRWLASLNRRIVVPGLWLYEVTTALYRHTLQGWAPDTIHEALIQALHIPDEIVYADQGLVLAAYTWAVKLGQGAAYDAFYLALAEHLGAEFWTGDKRLYNRCRQVGADFVHLVGAAPPEG